MKKRLITIALVAASSSAMAGDLSFGPNVAQDTFRGISEDLGSAFNYKNLRPAEPTGLLGFDVSGNVSYTPVANEEDWDRAFQEDVDELGSIGVSAAKGLPFGVDVGAYYGYIPDQEISFVGGTVAYAISEGGIISPAISIRASVMQADGIDDLDFDTKSVELSISKGFTLLTPYIGIGRVWVTSTPDNISNGLGGVIKEEKFSMPKVFGGVKIGLPGIQLAAEVDKTGDATSFGLRLGIGF